MSQNKAKSVTKLGLHVHVSIEVHLLSNLKVFDADVAFDQVDPGLEMNVFDRVLLTLGQGIRSKMSKEFYQNHSTSWLEDSLMSSISQDCKLM